MDIWSLHRQGLIYGAIGKRRGLDRRTVMVYVKADGFPDYQKRKRTLKLERYHRLIRDWLQADDYTATWIQDRLKLQALPAATTLLRDLQIRRNPVRAG